MDKNVCSKFVHYIFLYDDSDDEIFEGMVKEDIEYLKNKWGGKFTRINDMYSIFWLKPRCKLFSHEYGNINAIQVLERNRGEDWIIVNDGTTRTVRIKNET